MKKLLILPALIFLLTFTSAEAQVAQQPYVVNGTTSTGAYTTCPVGSVASTACPMPVTASGTTPINVTPAPLTAVAGTQRGVAIPSSTTLTVPATATTAVITPQGTNNTSGICAYWQDDGTVPTVAAGNPISALAVMNYKVTSLPIAFIQATGATCTLSVAYYK